MKIAVVAPSGPPDAAALQAGIGHLRRRSGLDVHLAPNIGRRSGYLAGEDAERIEGIAWAFRSGADVIWFARGGFGATRIAASIPWPSFLPSTGAPPTLVGYSDATALLVAYAAIGGRAVHGPMLGTDLARGGDPRTWDSIDRMLLRCRGSSGETFSFEGRWIGVPPAGPVEGRIVVGNLAVLAALSGTSLFPSGEGALVCLEEVNEEPYRVDRLLTQLRLAGLFDRAAGVVFGGMTDCVPEEPDKSFSLEELLERFAAEIRLPVVAGLPFGHGGVNTCLPMGGRLRVCEGNGFEAEVQG